MDRILLEGLRVSGRHGALAGEQDRPQPFLVDVEIGVDAAKSAADDRLEETVDVREVASQVRAVVEGPPCRLVETLAERVAGAILGLDGVLAVTVRVTKPEAELADRTEHPYTVEVRRPRDSE